MIGERRNRVRRNSKADRTFYLYGLKRKNSETAMKVIILITLIMAISTMAYFGGPSAIERRPARRAGLCAEDTLSADT
jgi:hypothetical protein